MPEHETCVRGLLTSQYITKLPSTAMANIHQGAEIADNAICGGGDPAQGYTNTVALLTSGASTQLKAIIWAGNPRHSSGEPFNYGSCTAGGVSVL